MTYHPGAGFQVYAPTVYDGDSGAPVPEYEGLVRNCGVTLITWIGKNGERHWSGFDPNYVIRDEQHFRLITRGLEK